MPQLLRITLKATGILRPLPKMLPLRAVQRQAATSRSAKPLMRLQHGSVGGDPISTFTNFNTSAHTTSLRVFIGQLAPEDGT